MIKKQLTENCLCPSAKQKWVRFKVVKFSNNKYGVVDNLRYELIDSAFQVGVNREDTNRIIETCQMTLDKAKKLCKTMNKNYNATQFQEID